MKILLTGGAGYIGSHTYAVLKNAGHEPVIVDDFSQSDIRVLDRLREITQAEPVYENVDIHDAVALNRAFDNHKPEMVIHFAGLKSVSEGEAEPLKYYAANIGGTISLLNAMEAHGIQKLIFSSAATVYGPPQVLPIDESHPLNPASTYGQTKLIIENLLHASFRSGSGPSSLLLRYFNPVGAHESGRLGEHPVGPSTNLMPILTDVAMGKIDKVEILGGDYDTVDGTGLRDFIHVQDLANAHLAVLNLLDEPCCTAINIGSGHGITVLEMIRTFEAVNGIEIPYSIAPRRAGDIGASWASNELISSLTGWKAEKGLHDMCKDAWRWRRDNPLGYQSE